MKKIFDFFIRLFKPNKYYNDFYGFLTDNDFLSEGKYEKERNKKDIEWY